MGEVIRRSRDGKFLGFYLRWYEHGRRRQMASKQATFADAKKMLQAIEGRVARGLVGIPERSAAPTVAVLCERFLVEYSRPKVKDLTRYRAYARTALRRVWKVVGSLQADALTAMDIARLRERLARQMAANTVRLTLSFFSTVYSWAIQQGIVDKNPVHGVELPARRDAMEYLNHADVQTLLACADSRAQAGGVEDNLLHACVATAIYTGLRKGELCGLRWSDLDLQAGRMTVARSFGGSPKSNRPRPLRIPDALQPVLTRWSGDCPRTREGLLFPRRRRGGWQMAPHSGEMLGLPALIQAAGLRRLARPWHALRHTFASHYMMAGGSLLALAQILGHADIKMTMVYAHLAPDFIAAEMNRIRF